MEKEEKQAIECLGDSKSKNQIFQGKFGEIKKQMILKFREKENKRLKVLKIQNQNSSKRLVENRKAFLISIDFFVSFFIF